MITKDLREMMKAIILAILVISFVTASPLVQEDTEQLLREERAIAGETDKEAKEPGQLSCGELKCGKGKYAKITKDDKGEFKSLECVPCPAGEISKKRGLPLGCTSCQGGASSPDGSKCSAPCKKGQGWNEEKSTCDKCEPGTYNDEEVGVNPCKPCPTKFHESKKGSASCIMNCPAGFEPNEDGTSCRACKYGTYNNKAGKRGKNRQCMSCCGGEGSECPKNWTLTTGADSKQHCFKLHPKQNDCFKGLVEALRKISMKMNKDDNEDMRFRKAFCRSKLNLEELRAHYAKCGERTVKTSDETEQKLHPKMKSEDGKELSLDRLFDPDTEISCDMMDDGEDVGEHSGDSAPPSGIVEGEWDHQNGGDRKPPADGGKPKDGDGKQEEGGDQKPPEGGDQKPPEGGDQKPPAGGNQKPPEGGDDEKPPGGDGMKG